MPLIDAFVADISVVKSVDSSTEPLRDLGAIDVKKFDIVKLAQLQVILTGQPFKSVLQDFPEVHEVSDDGPWVFEVSRPLTDMLADMSELQLQDAARKWATLEEFKLDRIDETMVTSVLMQFVKLAQLARSTSQQIYLWMCL